MIRRLLVGGGAVLLGASLLWVVPQAQAADGPGSGAPWIVSLGDSAISGEGGRWAGNANGDSIPADALGRRAYHDGGFPGPITGLAGKCIDGSSNNPANGARVILFRCTGSAKQVWQINDFFSGDGTLRALGKCLDVQNGGTSSGTRVQLWDCNGTGAQKWRYVRTNAFYNPQSGRCLDLPNSNTTDGTQLQIWDCNGTGAQNWAGPQTYEQIRGCHRSHSAEVYIGGGVNGMNFACSGARTYTTNGADFKPGIDFAPTPPGLPDNHKGQALLLQEFATTHNVKAVTLMIGANNLGYTEILEQCISDWFGVNDLFTRKPYLPVVGPFLLPRDYCYDDPTMQARFTSTNLTQLKNDIKGAINNVRLAMQRAGYATSGYTLLVQNYWGVVPVGNQTRYPESSTERHSVGGCPMWDHDADFANSTIVDRLNTAVRTAVRELNYSNTKMLYMQAITKDHQLCQNTVGTYEEKGITYWGQPGVADKVEWLNQARIGPKFSEADGAVMSAVADFADYIGLLDPDYQLQEGAHANFWGQLAMRNCLRQAYNNGSPQSLDCRPSDGGGLNQFGEPNITPFPLHAVAQLHCDPQVLEYTCEVENVGDVPWTSIRWTVGVNEKERWRDLESVQSVCSDHEHITVRVAMTGPVGITTYSSEEFECDGNTN